jgi:hypothetical protein
MSLLLLRAALIAGVAVLPEAGLAQTSSAHRQNYDNHLAKKAAIGAGPALSGSSQIGSGMSALGQKKQPVKRYGR